MAYFVADEKLQGYYVSGGVTINIVKYHFECDDAASLPAQTAFISSKNIKISMASTAHTLSDNKKYEMNSAGTWVDITDNTGAYTLPPATANSLGGVMVGDGLSVDDSGLLSGDFSALWGAIYQAEKHLSGVPPLQFMASGAGIESYVIYGNGQQTGTPTPNNPIMPTFCGTLDGTDWKIPITCAEQTTPVYLGQTPTVRRVKKVVFNGTENWNGSDSSATKYLETDSIIGGSAKIDGITSASTHYSGANNVRSGDLIPVNSCCFLIDPGDNRVLYIKGSDPITLADFKAYLAAQYANGTPVTIWYVLAAPETGIVNEPLAKIGDYCDELHSEDAGVTIPTAKGQNTLTVETDLQPSSMAITYF